MVRLLSISPLILLAGGCIYQVSFMNNIMSAKRKLSEGYHHDMGHTKNKKTREDDTKSDDRVMIPNPRASLLGLPPELRNRIYEQLLGNQLIHITTRSCAPYDEGAFRSDNDSETWGPASRCWRKWTHLTCQVPGDWHEAYALSKAPRSIPKDCFTESGTFAVSSHPSILNQYYTRHDACNWIQDDLQDRRYNTVCSHQEYLWHHLAHWCDEQLAQEGKMKQTYGPPATGVQILHASSKLNLSILSTCRQIHEEASLLPYALNTFNFCYPAELFDFISLALTPIQARAIRTLQTGSWLLEDIKDATDQLRGLKYLQYSGETNRYITRPTGPFDDVSTELEPHLEKAEVIFGSDSAVPSPGNDRASWRAYAEEMERFLMRPRRGNEVKEQHSQTPDDLPASVESP